MEQFNSLELRWRHNTTSSWEFGHKLNDTKQIDISIVYSEIDHYNTSTTINPQPFFQLRKNRFRFFTLAAKQSCLMDNRRPSHEFVVRWSGLDG